MTITSVGVVYSGTTWRIRSIIVPDDDTQLLGRSLGKGELMQNIALSTYLSVDLAGLQSLLNGLTGNSPVGDRYVSVDGSGNVVDIHIADPIGCGDASPHLGCILTAHSAAIILDILWNGKFLPNIPMSRVSNSLGLNNVLGRSA